MERNLFGSIRGIDGTLPNTSSFCEVSSHGYVVQDHSQVSKYDQEDDASDDDIGKLFGLWLFGCEVVSEDPERSIVCHVQRVRYVA